MERPVTTADAKTGPRPPLIDGLENVAMVASWKFRGERLVVTDRKRPIAELAPVARGRLTQEQWFQFLEETGELTRASNPRRFKDVKPKAEGIRVERLRKA